MLSLKVDRANGVLFVTLAGAMTAERLAALEGQVVSFIAREGRMSTIVDFSGVTSVEIDIPSLVDRGRGPSLMSGKPRIYVAIDTLLLGLLRLYSEHQVNAGEMPPTIVPSLADAFDILGLVQPNFKPLVLKA
jgi:hypothetical protein